MMCMLASLFLLCVLSCIDICQSATTLATSYNTGYIVQTIYSDKNCTKEIQKKSIVLGQCIYLNSPTFNNAKILSAQSNQGIASVKYKWDFANGFLPIAFYSDTACANLDATKGTGTGVLLKSLETCSLYNNGLNSFQMTYFQTYDSALAAMKTMDNYTLTISYSSKEICEGSTTIPVYMEAVKINKCYADSVATSMYTTCQDRQISYSRTYQNADCDASQTGYSVPMYSYSPTCSSDSFTQYTLNDATGGQYTIVAGYESSSCGVYDDSTQITLEFVLPIALAAFFFSVTFCQCIYIFCYLHRGALTPPPKFTREHFKTSSV